MLIYQRIGKKSSITHIELMFPLGTSWKNQKTVMSLYVFRGSQMATLAQHRLEQDKPLTLT